MMILACTLALALAQQSAAPPPAVDPRWTELVRLREEVETLASSVEAERASMQDEVAALEKRKRAVQAEIDAARSKARELDATAAALRDPRAENGDADRAAVVAAIARGREHVRTSIPLDLDARRAPLDDAERALAAGSTAQAAELAWRFVSQERALADSVGRSRAPITIDGKRVMADVLHVGLVALYARTRGGTLAVIERDPAGHDDQRATIITDPEARAGLLALFEATKAGEPRGLFMVPR